MADEVDLEDVEARLRADNLIPPVCGLELREEAQRRGYVLITHSRHLDSETIRRIANAMGDTAFRIKQVAPTDGMLVREPDGTLWEGRDGALYPHGHNHG